ncbi:MAG: pyridoxal phosphate-dependent aminotransferase [Bacillota bacterium]|nr:pyridoxal phosphate-dependent aminotransferase [Bacillota bacterium]
MLNEEMLKLGTKRSVIRELFEYGKKRAAEIGAENVYDFSIGNPSVPPPPSVTEAIKELLESEDSVALHGYTSAQGDACTRRAMADHLNKTYGETFTADSFYMTCGAAASLMISLKAMVLPGEEVVVMAPYFPEYNVFIRSVGGNPVVVAPRKSDFQIDVEAFAAAITDNTKAVIINSPNNPSGVVYSEATIKAFCEVMEKKSAQYGHPIYLITDEPYRELVYDGITVPFMTKYYDNTVICYSFSKSLSLPGERVGYIALCPRLAQERRVYAAVCGAGRSLGYVCAPSLFQKVAARCVGQTSDISIYKKNRDILSSALTDLGFRCIRPDGAFYLFVESPEEDANAFCEKAKKHELLLVPGDDFGCRGFVRISYCVSTEMIQASLDAFAKLAQEYK